MLWVHPRFPLLLLELITFCQGRESAWEEGKQRQATFNGAPLGLPSKDSSSINLVLLVAAHHRKRDHFLRKDKNKVTFSSRKTSKETKLVSKVLGQAVLMLLSSAACRGPGPEEGIAALPQEAPQHPASRGSVTPRSQVPPWYFGGPNF